MCRSFQVRGADLCDPLQGTKLTCNYLAQRIHHLTEEIDALDAHLGNPCPLGCAKDP